MKRALGILLSVVLLFLLMGCNSKENVTTDGSTSMEKVIGALGEVFQNETQISVTYNPTGSGAGIEAVVKGRCDIGLSSRSLKSEEKQKGLSATPLAFDGIAVIVNKQNKISDLSLENLRKIFKGDIKNWKELGGKESSIVVIGREAGSGTREGFEAATDTTDKCKYNNELTSSGDIITKVSENPAAIGYISLATVKKSVKVISIDGITPTDKTIKNGSYKVQRPFILVTRETEALNDNAKRFFDYITSPAAHEIILFAGVIPAD